MMKGGILEILKSGNIPKSNNKYAMNFKFFKKRLKILFPNILLFRFYCKDPKKYILLPIEADSQDTALEYSLLL